jgi:hypothetical protein
MDQPPAFQGAEVIPAQTDRTFEPTAPDRRGEGLAWLSAAGSGLGTLLLSLKEGSLSGWGMGLTTFLLALAALVTFGNWIDRNTRIRFEKRGVRYSSPLRKEIMSWEGIRSLIAIPMGSGWRIEVRADSGRFHFRTGSSLRFGSFDEMHIGFPEGDPIAKRILDMAELGPPQKKGSAWVFARR